MFVAKKTLYLARSEIVGSLPNKKRQNHVFPQSGHDLQAPHRKKGIKKTLFLNSSSGLKIQGSRFENAILGAVKKQWHLKNGCLFSKNAIGDAVKNHWDLKNHCSL